MYSRILALLLSLICMGLQANSSDSGYTLILEAGDLDRKNSIVSFDLPELDVSYTLQTAEGEPVPLQIDWLGRGWFRIDHLPRGKTAEFILEPSQKSSSLARVNAKLDQGKIIIAANGRSILAYQAEKSQLPRPEIPPVYRRGGYLHPVYTPSGRIITDDYPANHVHHHGIWFPWTKTEFQGRSPDFWNMGQEKGTVEFVSLGEVWSGPVHAGFLGRHRFVDLTAPAPVVALNETWEVRVYAPAENEEKPYFLFDLVSRQECASDSPLRLPEFHYGGLGFRGHWDWNGKENTYFLTSEGITDREKGHGTRARWCHISGPLGPGKGGIAILGHPENFRAPQPMRLHPSEPFFCFAPSQMGDWEIEPGKPYVSRYRFVVQDGEPDREQIDRLWKDYAHPIGVTLKRRGE